MGRKTEPLSGGLVTDKDAALLKPGQLSDMRNMVYKNGAASLERAPGRILFASATAAASAVAGLRDITFDTGDRYLVAMVDSRYRYSSATGAAVSGAFTDLASITTAAGQNLEVVHYRNRFFLMNGATADSSSIGTNKIVYMTATAAGSTVTARQHGMLPVVSAPTITTAAGVFGLTATGYYEYWTTEVAKISADGAEEILESAFSSENGVSTVLVSTTSAVPTIQQPTTRNLSFTNYWRVYRSPKKETLTAKKFPSGFMVFEGSTGASAFADTTAVVSASSLPSTVNTVSRYFGFASASSVFTDNAVYASGTVGATPIDVKQGIYGFTLGSFRGNVNGIIIEVQGYIQAGSAPVPITVAIGNRSPAGSGFDGGFTFKDVGHQGRRPAGFVESYASKSSIMTGTAVGTPETLSIGASGDRWFPTNQSGLVDTDFDSTFMVVLSLNKANTTIGIDYVKAYVYYQGSIESTVQYPTVVYNFGDISTQVSKNFPPPSANTGDLFQDSLVTNDMASPSFIRYSSPGAVEYFPPPYFIDFETRENDIVRAIRVVNNRLVVGLDSSIWRINYLPSERDASFDRGKAVDVISRSQGIVNPMCCTTFNVDGQSEQLAFISNKGLCTTDGFNFVTRSKNLTWRNHIAVTDGVTSTPIALLNDPENRCLRFFYRNDSAAFGNETYMCLWASYDRNDIDGDGNFKFSGPVHVRNYDSAAGGTYASVESAWSVPLANGNTNIYIGYGGTNLAPGAGKVFVESGSNIPSNDQTSQYTTRRIYAAGLSGEWMLDDLYGYCGTYSGSPIVTYTFKGVKTNDTGETTRGSKTLTLIGQNLHHVSPRVQAEGLRINAVISGVSAFSQEMLVLGSTQFGAEDSGR